MQLAMTLSRRTDPVTSKEAGESQVETLAEKRETIYRVMRRVGQGITHDEIIAAVQRHYPWKDSTIRTRVAELVDAGRVIPFGKVQRPGQRAMMLWRAV